MKIIKMVIYFHNLHQLAIFSFVLVTMRLYMFNNYTNYLPKETIMVESHLLLYEESLPKNIVIKSATIVNTST